MNTIKFNKLYIFGITIFFSAILFILFGLITYFAEIFLGENFFAFFFFERNTMILIFVDTATLLFLVSKFVLFVAIKHSHASAKPGPIFHGSSLLDTNMLLKVFSFSLTLLYSFCLPYLV